MNRSLLATFALAWVTGIALAREPEDGWSRQQGITEGVIVEGTKSPDQKHALFEFNFWEGATPDSATSATGIGLAPVDRSKLLFVIDSRTEWMTDKKVTSFLTVKWNQDSTLLATHDSGAKHSQLNIYLLSPTGTATALKVPDLLSIAVSKLGMPVAKVSASGQTPLRWRTPEIIEVSVGVITPKGKFTATIPMHVDSEGLVSTQ
jgi:hypothetical protein